MNSREEFDEFMAPGKFVEVESIDQRNIWLAMFEAGMKAMQKQAVEVCGELHDVVKSNSDATGHAPDDFTRGELSMSRDCAEAIESIDIGDSNE